MSASDLDVAGASLGSASRDDRRDGDALAAEVSMLESMVLEAQRTMRSLTGEPVEGRAFDPHGATSPSRRRQQKSPNQRKRPRSLGRVCRDTTVTPGGAGDNNGRYTRTPASLWSVSKTKRLDYLPDSQRSPGTSGLRAHHGARPGFTRHEEACTPRIETQARSALVTRRRIPGCFIGPPRTRKRRACSGITGPSIRFEHDTRHGQQQSNGRRPTGPSGLQPCRTCQSECWFNCPCRCHRSGGVAFPEKTATRMIQDDAAEVVKMGAVDVFAESTPCNVPQARLSPCAVSEYSCRGEELADRDQSQAGLAGTPACAHEPGNENGTASARHEQRLTPLVNTATAEAPGSCCTFSCWFGCTCRCHAGQAVIAPAFVHMGIDENNIVEESAVDSGAGVANGPPRRTVDTRHPSITTADGDYNIPSQGVFSRDFYPGVDTIDGVHGRRERTGSLDRAAQVADVLSPTAGARPLPPTTTAQTAASATQEVPTRKARQDKDDERHCLRKDGDSAGGDKGASRAAPRSRPPGKDAFLQDVIRAFDSTSEAPRKAWEIKLSRSARFPRCGVFGTRLARVLGGAEGEAPDDGRGGREESVRPRVKGFLMSQRARDPVLARAESAAAVAISIASKRSARAPSNTVRDASENDRENGNVIAGVPGSPKNTLPETRAAPPRNEESGEREVPALDRDPSIPPAGAGNCTFAEPPAKICRQTRDGNSVAAEGEGDRQTGVDGRSDPTSAALEAPALNGTATTTDAARNGAPTTNRPAQEAAEVSLAFSGCDQEAPRDHDRGGSEQRQDVTRQAAAQQPLRVPSAVVFGADTFLSHRPKTPVPVFARVHAHQARRRKGGSVPGTPGPGHYDISSKRGRVGGPVIAPKRRPSPGPQSPGTSRTQLKDSARAVVDTRRVITRRLRGPGEYDVVRAEVITRVRRVTGSVCIRTHRRRGNPTPTSPACRDRRGRNDVEEIYGSKKDKNDGGGRRHAPDRERRLRRGRSTQRRRRARNSGLHSESKGTRRSLSSSAPSSWSLRREEKPSSGDRGGYDPWWRRHRSASRRRRYGSRGTDGRGRSKERATGCEGYESTGQRGSDGWRSRSPRHRRGESRRKWLVSSTPRSTSRRRSRWRSSSVTPQSSSGQSYSSRRRRGEVYVSRKECGSRVRARRSDLSSEDTRQGAESDQREPLSASSLGYGRGPGGNCPKRRRSRQVDLADGSRNRGRGRSRRPADYSSSGSSGSTSSGSSGSTSSGSSGSTSSGANRYHCGTSRGSLGPRSDRITGGDSCRRVSMPSRATIVDSSSDCSSSSPRKSYGSRTRGLGHPNGILQWRRRRRRQRGRIHERRKSQPRRLPKYRSSSSGTQAGSSRASSSSRERAQSKRRRQFSRPRSDRDLTSADSNPDVRDVDAVWKGFLATSKKSPAWKFAPLEKRGVSRRNRHVVESGRLPQELARDVGYRDAKTTLTEARTTCLADFAAQAESRARERARILSKPRVLAARATEARASVGNRPDLGSDEQARGGWVLDERANTRPSRRRSIGRERGRSLDHVTSRRVPSFRYVEDAPLPVAAANRVAEREEVVRRQRWLDVNVHTSWAPKDSHAVGDAGLVNFDRAPGREKVEVRRKGQRIITPFDRALRPSDDMGPGRYESEDLARTTRTGRLGDAPAPLMALGVPRSDAVGPRGERPTAAAESEREDMQEVNGGALVLHVDDRATTRRRRVPGGVIPLASRWTEDFATAKTANGTILEGQALDIDPEAGKDALGPRRDKGHRYLRFNAQPGRGGTDSVPPKADEGDVLILEPVGADARLKGTAVDIERQTPRWLAESRGPTGDRDPNSSQAAEGDVLLLDPDHNAVRLKPTGAPAFENQVRWREWQGQEALERDERMRGESTFSWAWKETPREGRSRLSREDGAYKADLLRRPRVVSLVNMDKQQPPATAARDEASFQSPTSLYRHADYDVARGLAQTAKRRASGIIDMSKSHGGAYHYRGYFSDGERHDGHGEASRHTEGDELILSPKWSFVRTRSGLPVAWNRSAATPRFGEPDLAPGEEEIRTDPLGYDPYRVEEARARTSRWRQRAYKTPSNLKFSKTTGRVSSLFGLPERHDEHNALAPTGADIATACGVAARGVFSDAELMDDRLMEGQRLRLHAAATVSPQRQGHRDDTTASRLGAADAEVSARGAAASTGDARGASIAFGRARGRGRDGARGFDRGTLSHCRGVGARGDNGTRAVAMLHKRKADILAGINARLRDVSLRDPR